MKNKIFWDVKEVSLETLRVGLVEMFLAYSVYDDGSSDVEILALDDRGEIYGAAIVVQDRYGENACKMACTLFSERGATNSEKHDYNTTFVTKFSGGQYRDGTRGKIQDALDALHAEFLKSQG